LRTGDLETLENFLETWFNSSFDFGELDYVIDRMKELDAWHNLFELVQEVRSMEERSISVEEINYFCRSKGLRWFTKKSFYDFKRKILESMTDEQIEKEMKKSILMIS
jgi:hypothetical protein